MLQNKKIAITGHMTGIGAALYSVLGKNNQVTGFARSNDKDLTDKDIYKDFVNQLPEFDIVINNAYSYDYRYLQTDILNDFLDANIHDGSRAIVTMGSMSKYVNSQVMNYSRYASSKVLIDNTVDRAKTSGHQCGLMVVSPNWVATPMLDRYKEKHPQHFASITALSAIEVADQIELLLDMFYNKGVNVYSFEMKRMR